MSRHLLWLIPALFLLAACNPGQLEPPAALSTIDPSRGTTIATAASQSAPSSTPTPIQPSPTITPTPWATATWYPPTPSPIPTNTFAPGTPSPTLPPLPTMTPVPPPPGIVYRDNEGLWLTGPDWQPILVSIHDNAVLSPDGRRLLFEQDGDLWLVDRLTDAQSNLTVNVETTVCCAQWWPARPDLVIVGLRSEEGPNDGQTALLDANSGQLIWRDEGSSGYAPRAGSPDGLALAFDRAGSPWLYHLGNEQSEGGVSPLNPTDYGLPGGLKWGSPAWSLDGRFLAWAVGGPISGEQSGVATAVLDMVNQSGQLLHPYQPLGRGGWLLPPTWSPDGRYLAVLVEDVNLEQFGNWVLEPATGAEWFLGRNTFRSSPRWSPDGQWLLVAVTDRPTDASPLYQLLDVPAWYPLTLDLPGDGRVVGWIQQ